MANKRALFRKALERKWHVLKKWQGPHIDLEVLVVSTGGVGTTTLIEHLSKFVTVNDPDDIDGLKHSPLPNLQATRTIYLYGDIRRSTQSLRRRGYEERTLAKLGAPFAILIPDRIRPDFFLKLAARGQIRRFIRASKKDAFRFLVLTYEELFESAEEIAAFLKISDDTFVAEFPRRRPGTSV